jgi:signal transduction histidine kinase
MSSRLSHELRTPVVVVRSSLEQLELHTTDETCQKYIMRAKEGVARLNKILTTMSEATRLEHAIDNTHTESFDLTEVIAGCIQGYTLVYPNHQFEIIVCDDTYLINGVPEFIAQLLDKLVNNAVDFAEPNSPITVTFTVLNNEAVFTIFNRGPQLPDDMANHIFDSMVSVRETSKQQEPHLGLGLYMARLICDFHKASIEAINQDNGVAFVVKFSADE